LPAALVLPLERACVRAGVVMTLQDTGLSCASSTQHASPCMHPVTSRHHDVLLATRQTPTRAASKHTTPLAGAQSAPGSTQIWLMRTWPRWSASHLAKQVAKWPSVSRRQGLQPTAWRAGHLQHHAQENVTSEICHTQTRASTTRLHKGPQQSAISKLRRRGNLTKPLYPRTCRTVTL
jgi:hypothetical protein